MQWFKHDSNAILDNKIRKVVMKYGAEGYAVYFHCLELIAGNISDSNITFELEHDSEIIADDLRIVGDATKSGADKVTEIMQFMISLELFTENNGHIFCFKLLKRLDSSMTSNPRLRNLITKAKQETTKNQGSIMTASCDSHDTIMQEKKRIEKNRIEYMAEKTDVFLECEKKSDDGQNGDNVGGQCPFSDTKSKNNEVTMLRNSWYDKYQSVFHCKPDETLTADEKKVFWAKVTKVIRDSLKRNSFDVLQKTLEWVAADSWYINTTKLSVTSCFGDGAVTSCLSNKPHSGTNNSKSVANVGTGFDKISEADKDYMPF